MILSDTEDLEALREVTRHFFGKVDPHTAIELTARVDRPLWERACQELGMAAVDVPESQGGLGLGPAGNVVLLEEAARALAPLPLLGSVVRAQGLLLAAGDQVLLDELLPGMLAGETILAVADRDGPEGTTATRAGDDWLLTGGKLAVLDGMSADLFLVDAETPEGTSLFLVDAAEVSRSPSGSLDLTRDFAALALTEARGRLVGGLAGGAALSSAVQPAVTVAVAAEAVGSAEACLWEAVGYARTRVQFGREIGGFQAIKHALADVAVELDDARSALEHAMWAASADPDRLPLASSIDCDGGTPARQRRERAGARRHRLHVGAHRTPALPARPQQRCPVRRRAPPPRGRAARAGRLTCWPTSSSHPGTPGCGRSTCLESPPPTSSWRSPRRGSATPTCTSSTHGHCPTRCR
jgi:alkylation response protein AidB-like acyl-CoA dehydrogenase